jgi:hypothetical protein
MSLAGNGIHRRQPYLGLIPLYIITLPQHDDAELPKAITVRTDQTHGAVATKTAWCAQRV